MALLTDRAQERPAEVFTAFDHLAGMREVGGQDRQRARGWHDDQPDVVRDTLYVGGQPLPKQQRQRVHRHRQRPLRQLGWCACEARGQHVDFPSAHLDRMRDGGVVRDTAVD